jgi:hypothetical protein
MQSEKEKNLLGDIRNGISGISTAVWHMSQYPGDQIQWTESAVNAGHGQIVFLSTTDYLRLKIRKYIWNKLKVVRH